MWQRKDTFGHKLSRLWFIHDHAKAIDERSQTYESKTQSSNIDGVNKNLNCLARKSNRSIQIHVRATKADHNKRSLLHWCFINFIEGIRPLDTRVCQTSRVHGAFRRVCTTCLDQIVYDNRWRFRQAHQRYQMLDNAFLWGRRCPRNNQDQGSAKMHELFDSHFQSNLGRLLLWQARSYRRDE